MSGAPTFLAASEGVCRECRRQVQVRYVADGAAVYLERHCPEHGAGRALVAESLAWFLAAQRHPPATRPPLQARPRAAPCPRSCGPCELHAQRCHLPVVSVTNACDLRCPICFTFNRADRMYFMTPEELGTLLDRVLESAGEVDLVNITGGEPTLHPRLDELIATATRPGIGRVTVNSNGLRLAKDPDLARMLSDLGAYVVLSLDTLDPATSVRLHGRDITAEKLRALANLERFGVPTTLLMVLIAGENEGELGNVLRLTLESEVVRSLTIQTMTYTGQGGGSFLPRRHIPVDGVARRVAEASGGRIGTADFLPLPTAHPLCYAVTYLLLDGAGGVHPLTRVLPSASLRAHLAEGYFLHPSDALSVEMRGAIDRLWSQGADPALLAALRRLIEASHPAGERLGVTERLRRAERCVKTIYAHAHMDEDTFEVGRAMRCPDQVPVGDALIGACAYNLFYRMKDERFWVEP